MKKQLVAAVLALVIAVVAYVRGSHVFAATTPMNCNLSAYQGASGLAASVNGDSLVLTWDGERNQELRLRFVIDNGTPTIAELAWGDGQRTDRQISTTEATGFGQRHFEIPFDATGKKWVRFAAWGVAGNGALVQPIKLNSAQTSTR